MLLDLRKQLSKLSLSLRLLRDSLNLKLLRSLLSSLLRLLRLEYLYLERRS